MPRTLITIASTVLATMLLSDVNQAIGRGACSGSEYYAQIEELKALTPEVEAEHPYERERLLRWIRHCAPYYERRFWFFGD